MSSVAHDSGTGLGCACMADMGAHAGDLQKVSLILPPPGRLGAAYPGSDQLPPSTEKALGKLLAACGLENDFSQGTSPPSSTCSIA